MFAAVHITEAPSNVIGDIGVELPLGLAEAEMIDGRLAFGKLNIDLAAPVADHDIVKQTAQGTGIFGLARIGLFQEMAAERAYRAQLAGRQNGDQAIKLHQIILHRRGGQQQHIALAHLIDKLPGQRAAVFEFVRLVDDQQIKFTGQDGVAVLFEFRSINACDPAAVFFALDLLPLGRRLHHPERFVKFILQLLAPLFG